MIRPLARAALLATLVLPACAPSAGPTPATRDDVPSPTVAAPVTPADTARRPEMQPVPVPAGYRRALARGTRTATGAPGARYWQQRVRYRIDAELDPASRVLRGTQRVVYRNQSPDTLPYLVLNLYQNLFTAEAKGEGNLLAGEGVRLERVSVGGAELPRMADGRWSVQAAAPAPAEPGYTVEGTVGGVVLPRPLAPGDSAVLETAWRFRVPPEFAPRTGWEDALGGRVLQVAQWYPQVAVYDDVNGWDRTPYLDNGEFYLEYGDWDVSLTLPAGWLVGGSGTLQNAEEVLTPETRRRLASALQSDETVRVVTEAELRARTATLPGRDGRVTWRFRAENVRDFAFATSDRYLWDATRAVIPVEGGGTRAVAVHALYRPRAPNWGRAARMAQHATRFLSRQIVPYLYPQITVSEGPIYGMEYPMLVFIGRPEGQVELYQVISHEIAHEWFPMMVGQDEAAFAWMDEGVTTFHEALATRDFFPGEEVWAGPRGAYLVVAGKEQEAPLMQHVDEVSDAASGVSAYQKPATLLRSLRAVVGDSVFDRAMRVYAREWLLKHPQPWDFFATFERVSGQELDWFWEPFWFRTATLDQAVSAVERTGDGVRVTVRDLGEATAPTRVAVITAGGDTVRALIPVERWTRDRLRAAAVAVPVRGGISRVVLDPEEIFPDVNRRNNVWTANR